MDATLAGRTLTIEFGRCFGAREVARVFDTLDAFSPVRQVTLDFTRVRAFEEAAFAVLVKGLPVHRVTRVVTYGLDRDQEDVLQAFTVEQRRT